MDPIRTLPPAPHLPVEWRRAWRALRVLLADPQRTELAFEITLALAGSTGERLFRRFLAHPGGAALFAARPVLLGALRDRVRLSALPPGTLGRAYHDFMRQADLSADGLVAASAEVSDRAVRDLLDPGRAWFHDRVRDMHDLWHVVTGYGRDEAGEAALLAFSYAQTGERGLGFMAAAAAAIGPKGGMLAWQRYLVRAWRRGRHAALLVAVPWERLLDHPLDDVRGSLGIEPAEVAHAGGVWVATHDEVAAARGSLAGALLRVDAGRS